MQRSAVQGSPQTVPVNPPVPGPVREAKEALSSSELTIDNLQGKAPTIHEALVCDAEDDEAKTEDFSHCFRVGSCRITATSMWLAETEAQPRLVQLAEHVCHKNCFPQSHPLEAIPRYPTTLDNQLFKLRWRCVGRKRHD